ncbi:MAG TPA: M48 family metalloprotease [Xanthomonadaceae bacterium]|nr:M48 family metalloprotease [Xanthomonadaceae bacterium]
MPRHAPLTVLLAIALGCATPAFAGNEATLPDIGSSAGQIISPEQQHEYGEMTFRELRRIGYVLDDPLLEDWLQGVGDRLAASSNKPSQDFHFFVVNSRDINAFATLGGYVAVNAGLILTTTSEDELAGVMSHEIAHVTQSHVLRAVEAQKHDTIPIVLAMLAAIIVSSRSNSSSAGNAAEAAVASATGLMAQQQINFTRENETEADHFGIQTMARAGYDPLAMASFFSRMQAANRSNEGYGKYKAPDFLLDHPVTSTRISDALERARQIKNKPTTTLPDGIGDATSSLLLPANLSAHNVANATTAQHGRDFGWAQERLRVLSAESGGAAIAEYNRIRNAHPNAFGDAQRYGLALAMMQNAEPGRALAELQPLSQRHPDAYWIDLAIAKAQFLGGPRATALESYERVLQRMPGNRAVILSYATTLGEIGTADAGRRAQAVLRPLMADGGDDPEFQQTFARASELAGDTGRAGEAYAVAAYLNGRAEDALNQLEALKRRDDLDYVQRARIDARVAEMTPTVLEMHKQGIHAGDADKRQQQFAPQPALR